VSESNESLNSLEKTLNALRQTAAPRARPNPRQGGAPGGGSPNADATNALTAEQRGAIGDEVRRCWTYDPGAKGVDQLRVILQVTTDANGVARQAQVAPQDQGRMGDPIFRAFAERAVRAVLSAQCSNLPIPKDLLGQPQHFTFRFSPL
jgi:neural Wiskott-Aldrich syndrome protein